MNNPLESVSVDIHEAANSSPGVTPLGNAIVAANVAPHASALAKRTSVALIGWMPEADGARTLAGPLGTPEPTHIAQAQLARLAVGLRPEYMEADDVVLPLPPELAVHVQLLHASPYARQAMVESGEPALVDLTKLRAWQPFVHADEAPVPAAGDLVALAALTLPIPPDMLPTLPAGHDPGKQTFTFSSKNPNLKVLAHVNGLIVQQPGTGLKMSLTGFWVAVQPSFVAVAIVDGKHYLRDGYHRAHRLLKAGVRYVPALVKTFPTVDATCPPSGTFMRDIFLSARPPMLTDYADKTVAAAVETAVSAKVVIVQALDALTATTDP